MKKAIMELWVEALTSGRYKQTSGSLKGQMGIGNKSYGYCCLGVLCDVYAKKTGKGKFNKPVNGLSTCDFVAGEDIEPANLPFDVQKWASIKDRNGKISSFKKVESYLKHKELIGNERGISSICLATLNDSYGLTFKEIAKVIKDNYRHL